MRRRWRRPFGRTVAVGAWFVVPLLLIVALAWFFNARDEQFSRSLAEQRARSDLVIAGLDSRLAAVSSALLEEQTATEARGDRPVTPPVEQIVGQPVPGERGPAGVPGQSGAPGQPGKDAATPPCATTPPNFCVGPAGNAGPQGVQGIQGVQGRAGDPGPQGAPGAVGSQGDTGATGPQGQTGAQGPAGSPGTPGPTARCADLDPALGFACVPPTPPL